MQKVAETTGEMIKMEKKEFNKLIKRKNENELTRILNRYTNDLIKLTQNQVNKIIKIKEKIKCSK